MVAMVQQPNLFLGPLLSLTYGRSFKGYLINSRRCMCATPSPNVIKDAPFSVKHAQNNPHHSIASELAISADQFSLHRAPQSQHCVQLSDNAMRGPRTRKGPLTFKNVVIGSSALRICSWKKYARSPSQFSAGHCAGEKI